MSDESADEAQAVAAEIVRYLSDHSEAADTLEGVARWWLARRRHDETLAIVERAMSMLVSARQVERHVLPDGTVVYRSGPLLAARRSPKPRES